VAFHVVVGEFAAEKLPELPRLSRRQLLQHHNRLRKLSKLFRPELPRNFHDLTSNGVPIITGIYDKIDRFDGRKDQLLTDEDGRPEIYFQYDTGMNKPNTPIRFQFVTDPLMKRMGESNEANQTINYIVGNVLPEVQQVWDQYLGVVALPKALEIDQGYCFGFFINDLPPQTSYTDTDMIMIVSGYDVLTGGDGKTYDVCADDTLVVGSFCAVDEYSRPLVGFLNFCLNKTSTSPARNLQSQDSVYLEPDNWRTYPPVENQVEAFDTQDILTAAIHQTGHVLGMQFDQWKYYRNSSDASFYTPQPAQSRSIHCTDGSIRFLPLPASNTLQQNVTDGLVTFAFTLPLTQTVSRNHFNCPSLNGALLEADPSTPACVASHLNGRVFFGELMERLAYGHYDAISPFTLSILYDSFFYEAFYPEDYPFSFGVGAGCEFASGASCIVNDTIPSYGKGFYCTNPIVVEPNGTISLDQNDILCDPLHFKWALCDLYNLSQVPSDFLANTTVTQHWFSDKNLISTTSEADFCPMPIVMLPVNCNDTSTSLGSHYQGEVYGAGSRCVNAAFGSNPRSVPACFNVTCDAKNFRVIVNGITCAHDFEIHTIRTVDNQNATFECPRFATICPTLASCPSDCTGLGTCNRNVTPPQCICHDNTTTANCQNLLSNTFAPSPHHHATPSLPPVATPTKTSTSSAMIMTMNVGLLTGLIAAIVTVAW
jgi:hypothetical protein